MRSYFILTIELYLAKKVYLFKLKHFEKFPSPYFEETQTQVMFEILLLGNDVKKCLLQNVYDENNYLVYIVDNCHL